MVVSCGSEVNLVERNQKMKLNRLDRKYQNPSAGIMVNMVRETVCVCVVM